MVRGGSLSGDLGKRRIIYDSFSRYLEKARKTAEQVQSMFVLIVVNSSG